MGVIGDAGRGPVPSGGGLSRVLARGSAPPITVPGPYAGESRPPVAPAFAGSPVGSPVDGLVKGGSAPASSFPRAVTAQAAPVPGSEPGGESASSDLTAWQTPRSPGERHPVNGPTPRQVPLPDEPQDVGVAGARARPVPADESAADEVGVSTPGRAAAAASLEPESPEPGVVASATIQTAQTEVGPDHTDAPQVMTGEVDPTPEPSAPSLVREAVAVPQPAAVDPPSARPRDHAPAPEPVPPVVIGRIEVHVGSPAAEADPFAGCRVVAGGLTARRGGGW